MPSGANIALYETVAREPEPALLRVLTKKITLPVREFRPLEEMDSELRQLRREAEGHRRAGNLEAYRIANALATQAGWRTGNAHKYRGSEFTEWPLQVIRIGPVALVSVAGEPFSAIGRRIVDDSPFSHTLFSGYSNGGFGYLPDAAAYQEGGYEIEATPFRPEAAGVVVAEALATLREMAERRD